jgi:hypothetical protein
MLNMSSLRAESLGVRTLSIVRNSNKLESQGLRKLDPFPSITVLLATVFYLGLTLGRAYNRTVLRRFPSPRFQAVIICYTSSGEGRETPTLLCPLESANINLKTETNPVSETLCFLDCLNSSWGTR